MAASVAPQPSETASAPGAPPGAPAAVSTRAPPALNEAIDAASTPSEEALMERMRSSDPASVVALSREIAHRYPKGRFADERDSRTVDALLALGQVREAHYRAQLFVQHYPQSPLAQHVMNLMGVHARPAGVVPEPPDEDKEP